MPTIFDDDDGDLSIHALLKQQKQREREAHQHQRTEPEPEPELKGGLVSVDMRPSQILSKYKATRNKPQKTKIRLTFD